MATQNSSPYDALRKVAYDKVEEPGFLGQLAPFKATDPVASAAARAVANQKLWQSILAAAGVGLVGGGAVGLARLATAKDPYEPSPSTQPVPIMLPKKKRKLGVEKMAGKLSDAMSGITAPLFKKDWGNDKANWFFGHDAVDPWKVPALHTLAWPAGIGAMAAGYTALAGAGERAREDSVDEELEEAKKEYQRIVQQTLANKRASIDAELDELADLYLKQASAAPPIPSSSGAPIPKPNTFTGQPGADVKNIFGSVYLPYAVIAAIMSGKMGYDYVNKRSPEKVTEEALRRRAKERFGGVTPIYLEPAKSEIA